LLGWLTKGVLSSVNEKKIKKGEAGQKPNQSHPLRRV